MAAQPVFVFFLVTRMATMATSVTVSAPHAVSVSGGEPLQVSCGVWYEDDTEITGVVWCRQADQSTYGAIDVSTSCAHITVCEGHTADNRGRIRYERSSRNEATLTLAIGTSTLEDNINFSCGFFSRRGIGSPTQNTATISVSVNYRQDEIDPVCDVSSPSVLTCSSEITQPVVSLEWTILVNSSEILLSKDTIVVGDHVKNILHLDTLEIPYDGKIFTCYLTTEASPIFKGNCSIGPITISSTSPTGDTESTEASISTTRETETPSAAPSNPTTVNAGASETSQTRSTSQGKTQSWPSTPDVTAPETTQDTELSFPRPYSTPGITASQPTHDTELSFPKTDSTPGIPTSKPTQDTELSFTRYRTDSLSPAVLTTPSPSTKAVQSTFTHTTWHDSPSKTSTRHPTTISLSSSDETTPSTILTDPAHLSGSTLLIVVSGASGGAIIFLLVIVVCLVSRRKANKRHTRNVSMPMATISGTSETGRLGIVYGHRCDDQRSSQRACSYSNVPVGDNRPTSPVQLVAAYAVVPVLGLQQQPPPEYAVLDPDISSEEISGDDDTYACAIGRKVRGRCLNEDAALDGANFGHDAPEPHQETADVYAEIGPSTTASSCVSPRRNAGDSHDDRKAAMESRPQCPRPKPKPRSKSLGPKPIPRPRPKTRPTTEVPRQDQDLD